MNKVSKTFLMIAAVVGCLFALTAIAERADDGDRASKNGKAEGTVDGVQVTLEYGRPQVKDREIWGDLVPYGKVWRTGANEATTVTFSADVKVEGQDLAAGTYALFTIPEKETWTVVFNKEAKQWGAYKHDAAQDALRVTATPQATEHVEAMDFEFADDAIVLRWEKLALPIMIAAAK